MKKFLCVFLVIICVFGLVACGANSTQETSSVTNQAIGGLINKNEATDPTETTVQDSDNKNPETQATHPAIEEPTIETLPETQDTFEFNAKILEIHDSQLLVEPVSDSNEANSSNKIYVTTVNVTISEELKVNDYIRIAYDGFIQETYPAKIATVYEIVKYASEEMGPIVSNPISPLPTYTSYVVRTSWVEAERLPAGIQNADSTYPMYKFTSNEELNTFKNQLSSSLPFTQFDNALGDLDDKFFNENAVLVAYVTAGSGSVSYSVKNVTFMGNSASITLGMKSPEIGTCDMAGWFVIVVVPRATLENCTDFSTNIANNINLKKDF